MSVQTQNVTAEFHEDMWYTDDGEGIGGWIVTLEGCPGVWGSGETLDEAVDELPDVLRGWLEVGGIPAWPTVINTDFTGNTG